MKLKGSKASIVGRNKVLRVTFWTVCQQVQVQCLFVGSVAETKPICVDLNNKANVAIDQN